MKNEDIIYIIESNFRATRAEITANGDITKMLYDEIKKQNSRIEKVECKEIKNTTWRISMTAAGTAAIGIISFIFTKLVSLINAIK